ncbi:MAG TPA: Asp-tRNA(Asn)/Glu-tRNA(Gln) amidotransferase subunit GatC [Nitrososphaeraceae archaeon]|nr:Asp-tRNA(Asn)/Glu-tRNA(Gln) amidotransferase subunit GatC [Nitrososphaeraceae archaeon]
MISKHELEYLAWISKINLSEDEAKKFPEQLDKTIEYIDILEELAHDDSITLDLQEMKFDELRDDVVSMSGVHPIKKNLTEDGFLRGPKMR